jgi:DNA-binding LacI/PurR family transcriptional regulator
MAAGAIRNLVESDYRVPEDFSVIGYDNISLATLIDPPLTTIEQPLIEFGEQAAKIIIDLIKDGNNNTIQVSLNPKLIERKSCTAFEK